MTRQDNGTNIAAWIATGAGVALAGTGGVFVFLATEERATVEDARSEDGVVVSITHKAAHEAQDAANLYDTVGFVLVGVGVAALATGVVLFVMTGDDAESAVTLTPSWAKGGPAFIMSTTF